MSAGSGSVRRDIRLRFDVNGKEDEKIRNDAAQAGMPVSRYIRLTLMGAAVCRAPEADVPVLINEVRKVGMALERIRDEAGENAGISADEFGRILEENRRVEKMISEAYGTRWR